MDFRDVKGLPKLTWNPLPFHLRTLRYPGMIPSRSLDPRGDPRLCEG